MASEEELLDETIRPRPSPHVFSPPLRYTFSHAAVLCVLFGYDTPSRMPPLGLLLLLLWFLPRTVVSILAAVALWMLAPTTGHLRALLDHPYGSGTPPDKIKNADEAVSRE